VYVHCVAKRVARLMVTIMSERFLTLDGSREHERAQLM